jgi:hypothetical protein
MSAEPYPNVESFDQTLARRRRTAARLRARASAGIDEDGGTGLVDGCYRGSRQQFGGRKKLSAQTSQRHRGATSIRTPPVVQRELDDLLVKLKELVRVQALHDIRGATEPELERHTAEIERVRGRLAQLVRGAGDAYDAVA